MRTIESRTGKKVASVAGALVAALFAAWSGCGRQVVGVAKPAALLAWEPRPQNPSARITAVKTSPMRTYVGFSDGERLFKVNGAPDWAPYDNGAGACGQPTPNGPVTAFAVTEGTTFAAYAGTPGAPGLWRSPEDRPCWAQIPASDDFLSLSVSPFSTVELFAVSPTLVWVTHDLAGSWEQNGAATSFRFDGAVQAVAAGAGPTGAARAWLGDAAGHLYYSDDVEAAAEQVHWAAVSPDPGFPRRPIVAIAIDAARPQRVWVTFAGLRLDSLWASDDGASWRNPHGGDLADVVREADTPDAAAGASGAASFTAVSPVAGVGAAYVTALAFDRNGDVTATSFWTADGSDAWWRL
ncbi:MAG TPA: hypothetical protein VHM31_02610 [Polyangia bacterium]|nr:hypothetical protein [Polyangia bacterium]